MGRPWLGLGRIEGHPWLTQSLFNSHGMQSCWGRGREGDRQIRVWPTDPVAYCLLRDSLLPAAVGHNSVCVCVYVCVGQGTLGASTHHSFSLSDSKSLLNLNGK